MSNDVRVSVVIAAYNAEKYIGRMLETIVSQTLKEIEIICVDDGSSDNTVDIINGFATRDPRVHLYQNKVESDGAAMARNIGILHAKGEYLSILDADDFFDKNMLELMYQKALEEKADIVCCDGYEYDDKESKDKETEFILRDQYVPSNTEAFSPEEIKDDLFLFSIGAAWNGLYRREFVEHNSIIFKSFYHVDDFGFVYLAFTLAERIAVIKKKLVHYRKNIEGCQSEKLYLYPTGGYLALDDLREELTKRGVFDKYRVAFGQFVLLYASFYLEKMKDWESFRDVYMAFKNRRFEEYGVYDIPDNKIRNPHWNRLRRFIREFSPEDYVFCRLMHIPPVHEEAYWKKRLPKGKRVAIYGAGKFGSEVFREVFAETDNIITGWYDRNYEGLGYPVRNPEYILNDVFDYIIIAIISVKTTDQVINELKAMGISSQKIIRIGKEYE